MMQTLSRKKALSVLLAMAVAVAMIVIPQIQPVHAGGDGGPIKKTVYITKYSKGADYYMFWDEKGGVIKSIKSSKKSVIKPLKGGDVQLKKAGKAKLTFKVKTSKGKNKTYKSNVTVTQYKNPFKKVVVDGKNITTQFNSGAVVEYRDASQAKVKVTATASKGWKIKKVEVQTMTDTGFATRKIKNGATVDTSNGPLSVVITMNKGKIPMVTSVWFPQYGDSAQ